MHHLSQEIQEALAEIRRYTDFKPHLAMILGTGLGGIADAITDRTEIPYDEIPHFPKSTSPSHKGQLTLGNFCGVPVVAMEGRFHFYEGYSMRQITFPVRVMQALGAATLVVTNAAGGMNPQYQLADVMIIEDHINLLPDNPLRGVNDDALGVRFPDMSAPYDRPLIDLAIQKSRELALPIQKGVFVAVPGPNLETRAEYRMLRQYGADVVGMSTVPEVIVARHAEMRVLALSVVTDMCLPDALKPALIEDILEHAKVGGGHVTKLLTHLVPECRELFSHK